MKFGERFKVLSVMDIAIDVDVPFKRRTLAAKIVRD